MRKALFKLEFFGDSIFEGFTQDETWNGWAYPYFAYEESLKIMEAQNALGGKAIYESESDHFAFYIQDEENIFAPVEFEDLKLYPIGSGSWIWDEVSDSDTLTA